MYLYSHKTSPRSQTQGELSKALVKVIDLGVFPETGKALGVAVKNSRTDAAQHAELLWVLKSELDELPVNTLKRLKVIVKGKK